MIVTHLDKIPRVHPSAYVAPNAVVCGDVTVGVGCRVMFGACVVAEGGAIEIGENCIVMENAVIRSTAKHPTKVGSHCLVGPHAHLVGCRLEDCVFVATGASVFHGAQLGYGAEVRIGAVVHLRTRLPAHASVPIGWVAVGDPAQILPPDRHEAIWAVQKPLDFPRFVYGVERAPEGESNMEEITRRLSEALGSHMDDHVS
ncbi:MAG TPA: gamma carbonic anhydrase family protein [Pyrinomonadaceae bacterium]|jgi:carbonic anhydrase/acetyltransferase-like protein (isoleucine patch superfamily)